MATASGRNHPRGRVISTLMEKKGSTYPTVTARWLPFFVPGVLLGMTLAMFAQVLFSTGDRVLSQQGLDVSTLMIYVREFGFRELRAGRIALWDPHVFSGIPFMGGFTPALFYPPNWIYLILPPAMAMNWEIAIHVFLLGFFTALWLRRYRLHPLAILLASAGIMFGRTFFNEIFAGHVQPLDADAWLPLILLTVDSLLDEPGVKWVLVGIFTLAMQILAGYPPVVFYTVVACSIYGSIRLITSTHPLKTMLALCVIGAGAALITTVQLWTGLQTAAEGMRARGISFALASMMSLPPANLLGLLVPDLFGNMSSLAFFGVTGLAMAVLGVSVKSPHRGAWIASATLLLLIALGSHTPLLRLLYDFVPGFDRSRHSVSFLFDALIFVALLSAFGMDSVFRSGQGAKAAAAVLLITALAVGGFGAVLRSGASATPNGAWQWLQSLPAFLVLPVAGDSNPRAAGSRSLISAGICLVLAGLFFIRASRPGAAHVLAVFGIAEVFLFARSTVPSFSLAATVPAEVRQFLAAHPGDYRILNLSHAGWRSLELPHLKQRNRDRRK